MSAAMQTRGKLGAAAVVCALLWLGVTLPGTARGQEFQAAASGASVHFGEPADGATVKSPFKATMQVMGMEIKPAGAVAAGTGHHHIIVDGGPTEAGIVLPADATHLHFGKGQTETMLTLPPGKHSLTLQFADGAHRSYGSTVSSTITVTVE